MGDSLDSTRWREVAQQNKNAVTALLPEFGRSYGPVINSACMYLEISIKAILLESTGRLARGHDIDGLISRLQRWTDITFETKTIDAAAGIQELYFRCRYPDELAPFSEEDAIDGLACINSVILDIKDQGLSIETIDVSHLRTMNDIDLDERAEAFDKNAHDEKVLESASNRSEIEDAAIFHGFDRAEWFRKRRAEEHVAPPEADIVLVRKGEPGPDGKPVAENMVFAVAGSDGTVLGQDLLKTMVDEVDGIIDGSASVVPSVTAWISDYDLREIADIAKRPTNKELYELLAGVNEKSDEVVYDPLTEKLFVGYAGRDEPEVHLYEHAALGEVVEKAAQIVLNEGGSGNDPGQVHVAYDDVYIGDFSRSWDLEDQGDLDSLRDEIMALPDTWSRPSMEPITRSSVLVIAETCLAEQGRDSSAIYERAAAIAGFPESQRAAIGGLLKTGFTVDEIRRPGSGINEIDADQLRALVDTVALPHHTGPNDLSHDDYRLHGLLQGRYLARDDDTGEYMVLDNRSGVADCQILKTYVGAILYLDAIGDAKDGKIEVNDWLHEVDGAIFDRPELADVYHMWDVLCEGEANRAFSGMSAEPLEGPTAFADLWQGDAAQVARPLQVISALRDMADRHESAPLICGAILAFADEEVECRQDHERALVRAIADNRANPYGERFGDPIEEAGAAMRREVLPAIEAGEGGREGGEVALDNGAASEHGREERGRESSSEKSADIARKDEGKR